MRNYQWSLILTAMLLFLVGCQVQIVETPYVDGDPYAAELAQYVELYPAVQPLPLITQSRAGLYL